MTDAEARALVPGDRFRLRPIAADPHRSGRVYTVGKIVIERGLVEVVDADGFAFVPEEIERVPEQERRP